MQGYLLPATDIAMAGQGALQPCAHNKIRPPLSKRIRGYPAHARRILGRLGNLSGSLKCSANRIEKPAGVPGRPLGFQSASPPKDRAPQERPPSRVLKQDMWVT
eukprot:5169119-Pyramimonas_sp.AAC.1